MRNAWKLEKSKYNGLVMHCAPGTHEAAVSLLLRNNVPYRSVLDLASGSGAMLARLRDIGFSQLYAVELKIERFQLRGINPLAIDLNTEFSTKLERDFELIAAIEIIEHLDSPRHFLREVHALLRHEGYLLLTTPNIGNWIGRINFLLSGNFRWFEETQYRGMRHISPITDIQMRLMLNEIGFDVVESISAGDFAGPLRRVVMAPMSFLFRLIWGCSAWGDTNIYLARKASPT